MPADPNNLIWIDMEMTGLQPDSDRIIEMALLVTDAQLNILAESPAWVLHQPDEVLEAMDSWNKGTHAKTGLIGRAKAASLTEAQAETMALGVLAPPAPADAPPVPNVRQLDLPGPPVPRPLDAAARGAFPLPQPGRVHAEGAGAALEAGAPQGLQQGRQARGARRHPRVDRGA